MQEFEKKVLLTQEEYRCLLRLADGNVEHFIQINYYYDSEQLDMNRQGITCRIRKKNDNWEATVKTHGSENGCSTEETKEILGPWDDGIFRDMKLALQGKLTTTRTVLYSGEGLEVVLDANSYLGIRDYELEIEHTCENENHAEFVLRLLAELLCAQQINQGVKEFCTRTRFTQSKSARFFAHKRSLQEK